MGRKSNFMSKGSSRISEGSPLVDVRNASLSWPELLKKASAEGVLKRGMNCDQILRALESKGV